MKNHRELFVFSLMLLLVPLAGEPKIHPFNGDFDSFRVSFGSPIFLLFLLWLRSTPLLLSGFCVGLSVSIFRIVLDLTLYDLTFLESLPLRGPTFFYYLTYAACFQIPKASDLYSQALQIAGWSILAEFFASIAELAVTNCCFGDKFAFTFALLAKLIVIAVLRCFFILSFFFLTQLYQSEMRANHEREQKETMILLISNLYEEVVHLRKSQKNAEEVTRNCYRLYESLQEPNFACDNSRLARELLGIAGQVHDIKKDNQRIYAGLCQLTSNRRLSDYLPPQELCDIIVQTNRKYAASLKKTIAFYHEVDPLLPPLHAYTVLSLVNNLAANAVEAIKRAGTVRIAFAQIRDALEIRVSDTGAGIAPAKLNYLFKPGYTTKFDAQGNPSTGVGLPYIKHLAQELGGVVQVDITQKGATTFILSIPLQHLKG